MAVDAITGQPIFGGSHGVGLSNVGSYQAAGTPYMTGSTLAATNGKGSVARFEFPRVAKSVTVRVVPTSFVGGASVDDSDPVVVFFGEPKDVAGNSKIVVDTYNTGDGSGPRQFTQRHGYTLYMVSGSGDQATFGVRTDHINISVNGLGADAVGGFQIYAELTNIPAARMSDSYISGSGVNKL